jgi:basic membrane protein A
MSRRRFISQGVVLAASLALLAGCAPAPTDDNGGGGNAGDSDYCARMVTNSGGLEDRSFNQSSWEGLQQAESEFGIDVDAIVSNTEADLAPNVTSAVGDGVPVHPHGRVSAR